MKISTIIISTVWLFFFTVTFLSCKEETIVQFPDPPASTATPAFSAYLLTTDKAIYKPGDRVNFKLETTSLPDGAKVRYKQLNTLIIENDLATTVWSWQTPTTNFKGYLAEVYTLTNGEETILATVGIDVSSDWKKFPRYGFLSDFGLVSDKTIDSVIVQLNKYHINGLQFYDWQNKHHKPLPVSNNIPLSNWKDIGGRDVYFNTVQKYIAKAQDYNMKTMFYDLVYGAWENAEADGVMKEWYIYKDNTHTNLDFFALSAPFLSNLYLLDPANVNWQNYIIDEVKNVYSHLDFDGFHMDQVGNRGARYRYNGSNAMLENSFKPFVDAVKNAIPNKHNVLNAVAQFGQQGIATSASDFLYTEVWSPADNYNDLVNIIKQNNTLSNNTKNTVLAAYMNYDMASTKGTFNTPSVIMTNAVIFAFGGAHIELGEHMLCHEYYPNSNLAMKDDLKKSLVNYYDFAVAYQNLLRDGGTFNTITLTSIDGKNIFSAWPASQGKIAVFGKRTDTHQIIHLINFSNSTTQKWRDNTGIQVMPALIKELKTGLESQTPVKKIWLASPDIAGGAARTVNFTQTGDKVSFTIPELRYWDMVVVEY